jgi:hypothetical protein
MRVSISHSFECSKILFSLCSNSSLCSKSCFLSFVYLNTSKGVFLINENLSRIKNAGNAKYAGILIFTFFLYIKFEHKI